MIDEQEMTGQDTDQQLAPDPAQKRLFDFDTAKITVQSLIENWKAIADKTKKQRINRMIDLDPDVLQKNGQLAGDETIINWRLIDTNIKREQPTYVSFLMQSRRLITLEQMDTPPSQPIDLSVLEDNFSKGMKYNGWQIPHIMCVDGHQCHGWDSVEVTVDPTRPLHLRIDHVGNDNLIFPTGAQSLDACEHIIVKMTVSQMELRSYVDEYGFDAAQVDRILDDKNDNATDDTIVIYKRYFKYQGVVFVCWYENGKTDGWLKEPSMFVCGMKKEETIMEMQPVTMIDPMTGQPTMMVDPMTGQPAMQPVEKKIWVDAECYEYPIFLLRYGVTEEKRLIDNKGRAFIDNSKQEASCSLWSSLVNSSTRAANVYGSVAAQNMDGSSRPSMLEGMHLEPDRIYDRKIDMWSPPGPNAVVLSAAERIDTKNSAEVGQVAFSTMNREDSRKTATEMKASQNKENELSSVNMTTYSLFIEQVYDYCFMIARSRALADLIPLLLLTPASQTPEGPVYNNDKATLSLNFIIKAAGDIDYVKRREKLAAMKANWPVIQQTPMAMPYLIDMLKLEHPEDAKRYEQILLAGDQKKQLIQKLATVISQIAKEEQGQLDPSQQQMLAGLQQEVMQTLAQP